MEYWRTQKQARLNGMETTGQQQRDCYIYFGPTGCGKTTLVKENTLGEGKSLYTKSGENKWWCGYDDHETILMDEFKGNISLEHFNDITNKGIQQVECKGGMALLSADEIHIASNTHPIHWWKGRDGDDVSWRDPRYQAVARRIKRIYHWCRDGTLLQITPDNPKWRQWWDGPQKTYRIENPGQKVFEQTINETQDYFDFILH